MKRLLAISLIVPFLVSGLAIASETTGTIDTGGGLEGSSGLSGTVCPSTTTVAKPANPVATPTSASAINISWSSASGATAYRLYRATDAAFTTGVTKIYDGSSLSYSHTSLPAATTYYYKVNAVYSACGSSIESSFASQSTSARTDAATVAISNSSSGTVVAQELVDGGFTNSGGTLVGSAPIALAESGTLVVSVQFVSSNSIASSGDSATASADIGSGTVFSLSGSAYTGTLLPPVFQSVSTASELSASKNIVAVVKIGSDNGSLTFNTPITVRIPAPGLSAGTSVSIDYSFDGVTWQTLTGDSVELIGGIPYVVFTTTHFTYFAVGATLPVCTSSDFSIGAWSSCSSGTQTRSVSLLPGASCNSSAYTPATSQSCSSSSDSGGGGGGGGGGSGGSSSSVKTTASATTNSTTTTTPDSIVAPTAPREFPTNILSVDKPVSARLDRPGILQLDLPEADGDAMSVQLTASGSIVLRASTGASLAAVIPPNTTISSDAGWDGTISPPIVRSTRSDRVLIEVGNSSHTLTFDRDISMEVPVSLAEDSTVDVYVSTDGKNFTLHTKGVSVQSGSVRFTTRHFSYYLLRVATTAAMETPASVPAFADIEDSFAREYILRLTAMGVLKGYDDGTFRPDRPASRAEFLKIALKALGVSVGSDTTTRFSDVSEPWQIPVVETAAKLGIVSGQIVDGARIFRPDDSVTRAEALKILLSAAKISVEANAVSPFADVTDEWAIPYVAKAQSLGIVSGQIVGDVRVFRPNDPITRAEVTKIVVTTMDL